MARAKRECLWCLSPSASRQSLSLPLLPLEEDVPLLLLPLLLSLPEELLVPDEVGERDSRARGGVALRLSPSLRATSLLPTDFSPRFLRAAGEGDWARRLSPSLSPCLPASQFLYRSRPSSLAILPLPLS